MTDTPGEPNGRGSRGDRDRSSESAGGFEGRATAGGPVLDLDDDPPEDEGPPPECAVDGCHRDGTTAKKMPVPGADDEVTDQYVCRYHRLLFLGVRALVAIVVIAVFVLVYLQL